MLLQNVTLTIGVLWIVLGLVWLVLKAKGVL